MIKGKIQIDLHNHRTGLNDRYEQENMITDAIEASGAALGAWGASLERITPLCTKGLGGLLLFDNTLTEDATKYGYPTDAHIIAHAYQGVNTTDPQMGSINSLESGKITNGEYLNVWDFSTSQANGVIKALSLCHNEIGAVPNNFGCYASGSASWSDDSWIWSALFIEDSWLYRIENESGVYKINRYRSASNCLSIDMNVGALFVSASKEFVANSPFESTSFHSYKIGNKVYVLSGDGTNYTVKYIDTDDWTLHSTSAVFPYSLFGSGSAVGLGIMNGYAFVPVGATYTYSGAQGCVYKCALTGGDVTTINLNTILGRDGFFFGSTMFGGLLHLSYRNGFGHAMLYPDGEVVYMSVPNGGWAPTKCLQDGLIGYFTGLTTNFQNLHSWAFAPAYIGTICNLAQPIEKNSTTSMKVKYTITNE